jgi:hypothetical protein
MLPHTKEDVFDFAHAYGVPYFKGTLILYSHCTHTVLTLYSHCTHPLFKDSTPEWSTRGKLRNRLMPLLAEMYGVGFVQVCSAMYSAMYSGANVCAHMEV